MFHISLKEVCMRSKRFLLLSAVLITSSVIYLALYLTPILLASTPTPPRFPCCHVDLPDADRRLLVNTSTCRILDIDPYHEQVLPFINNESRPKDCSRRGRERTPFCFLQYAVNAECFKGPSSFEQWTYIEDTDLVVNKTAIRRSGRKLDTVSCCYQSIKRVKQSLDKYYKNADRLITFSRSCEPMDMDNANPLKDEFIRVQCSVKASKRVFHTEFHAVPQLTKTREITQKIRYWKSLVSSEDKQDGNSDITARLNNLTKAHSKRSGIPPNVVLLGMDSMSRLNFLRYMKKTKEYLELIGAIEMRGYSKVGDGTFPNAAAFMSGYSLEDLESICYFSPDTAQDPCPYLWKKFNLANYLTSYSEDGNTYTYQKTGFVNQPTDFYFRTFALALRSQYSDDLGALDCAGSKNTLRVIQNYVNDTLIFASRNNVPIFIYNWSDFAHDEFNLAQYADMVYKEFLQNIDLSNTILFVIGDHGPRFGPLRETFVGWFEDRLPVFWVHLPETIRRQFPTWLPSIRRNSGRLTSPHDFYKTLVHILSTFTPVERFPDARSSHGDIIPRRYGQTLFEDVPSTRKCHDVGVAANACPCGILRPVPTNSSEVVAASRTALIHLNQQLPKHCTQLVIHNITAAANVDDLQGNSSTTNKVVTYVVNFKTSPGRFMFEATVEANVTSGSYHVIGTVMRINKITKSHTGCLKSAILEKLCFCRH